MIRFLYRSILLLLICTSAYATTASSLNLALPNNLGSYQSDSFRADGMDCSMAIGASTNVEFGVLGFINNGSTPVTTESSGQNRDIGVYARITIPIGAPKNRLDCNELYQLELKKKRTEVQKLERELQNLRNLKFENLVK